MEGGAQRSLNNQIAGVGGEWEAPGAANTFNHPLFFFSSFRRDGIGGEKGGGGGGGKSQPISLCEENPAPFLSPTHHSPSLVYPSSSSYRIRKKGKGKIIIVRKIF